MDRLTLALLRPRHLLATFLVAIMTGAVGLTVTATTGEEELPSAWTAEFATPLPHVGDRGRYVHAGGDDVRDDGYWPLEVSFEWLDDSEAFDESAKRVLANQLLLQWGDDESQAELLLLEPGTHMQFSGTHRAATNHTQPGSTLFPEQTTSHTSTYMSFRRDLATMWCGIRTPLQGRAIDLTVPHEDTTACWNGPRSFGDPDYSIIVRAVGGVAPARTVIVDSYITDDLDHRGSRPFMRSTYLEGFPYATRVEFRPTEPAAGQEGFLAAYELAGHSLGTVPIASEPHVLGEAPPELVLAPRTDTGPDAAGVDHPYPLATAWQRAKEDPSFTELQAYLEAHPDAYIGHAYSMQSMRDGQISHEWYIVLTDGQEQFAYRHIHTPGPGASSPAAWPVPAPILQRGGGDAFDRLPDGWEKGPYPPPDRLPALMPSVESLARAWRHVSGWEDVTSYGFDLRCWMDQAGACQGNGTYYAGTQTDATSGVSPSLGMERDIHSSHLHATADGRLVGFTESETTQDYASVIPSPPAEDAPSRDEGPTAWTTLPETGWFPTAREAAAVGAAALLTTLIYWMWPLAKGGIVGLFSRVRTNRLLDNPLRQQIVEHVAAEPGIHHNALVRDMARGKGALEHHLDKLVAGRLLLRHRTKGYTCYFPAGTDRRSMAAIAATKATGARKVMAALQEGATGVREVAAATGLAPSTVSHHLQRLREGGLVRGDGFNGYSLRDATVRAAA